MGPVRAELNSALARFTDRVPGVRHVIAVGSDGLLSGMSPNLSRDRADAVAAITSGLVSLTSRSAGVIDGGRVTLTMMETHNGFMFMMPGPDRSALVAWAEPGCDVGQVGYELAVLASGLDAARAQMAPPGMIAGPPPAPARPPAPLPPTNVLPR